MRAEAKQEAARALDLVAETASRGKALPHAEHLARYTKACAAPPS